MKPFPVCLTCYALYYKKLVYHSTPNQITISDHYCGICGKLAGNSMQNQLYLHKVDDSNLQTEDWKARCLTITEMQKEAIAERDALKDKLSSMVAELDVMKTKLSTADTMHELEMKLSKEQLKERDFKIGDLQGKIETVCLMQKEAIAQRDALEAELAETKLELETLRKISTEMLKNSAGHHKVLHTINKSLSEEIRAIIDEYGFFDLVSLVRAIYKKDIGIEHLKNG
jgi:chromosome segregation ATPase